MSEAQQRALEAAEAGLIVRKHRSQLGGMLVCPGVRSKTLWNLLRDELICDGDVNAHGECVMTLTQTGQRELNRITSNE